MEADDNGGVGGERRKGEPREIKGDEGEIELGKYFGNPTVGIKFEMCKLKNLFPGTLWRCRFNFLKRN